jgi:hypothetical protein
VYSDTYTLHVFGFGDADLESLLKRQRQLRALELNFLPELTDAVFRIAGECCRGLKHLAMQRKC